MQIERIVHPGWIQEDGIRRRFAEFKLADGLWLCQAYWRKGEAKIQVREIGNLQEMFSVTVAIGMATDWAIEEWPGRKKGSGG